jgi:hypothetical protein
VNKTRHLFFAQRPDVHFEKIRAQTHIGGVSRKTAGHHQPAGWVQPQALVDPIGHPLPLGAVRHLVQAVQKEEQIAPLQETLAETLRGFQMGAGKLVLYELIQALLKVPQIPERQEDRQHVFGKADR